MGAYLSAPITAKEVFSGKGADVAFGGGAMQGWRKTMEDAHLAVVGLPKDPEVSIFGVFDGHGGSEVARFCQKYLVQEIQQLEHFENGRIEQALVDVFHRVDDMLRDGKYAEELERFKNKQNEDPDKGNAVDGANLDAIEMLKQFFNIKSGSEENGGAEVEAKVESAVERIQAGCTAIVAVKKNNKLYVANAGDSRGVLSRAGKAIPLSEDHKPAQETERKRILAAGGFLSEIGGVCRVNGNLNLSRAIGDLKYKANQELPAKDQIITAQPDVQAINLTPEDTFLVLACDGVWDVMSNQEVVDFVGARLANGEAAQTAACALLDACLASDPKESRGVGCDNMTALVVQLLP